MASNTTTIVAVFNDYAKAEQAVRELISAGIPKDSVYVQSNSRTTTAGRADYQDTQNEGGISGFFHRIFGGEEHVDPNEAGRYSAAVEGGRSVVIVNATEQQIDQSVAVLNQYGAIDIHEGSEGYDTANTDTAAYKAGTAAGAGKAIPVIDEQIKIGKRAVQQGGVRIYSTVVDRPVEEKVTLRDERVKVERRPVDRPISDAELSALRDQSFEMTESTEEPVVEKHARVKEEVVLGRETSERTETVRDSVRQTDVKVERFGDTGKNADYEKDFRNDWQKNYSSQGGDYEVYAPSYSYGYQYASDPRYKGRSWDEVEPQMRTDYERTNPGNAWEKTKNAVRYGWDRVTGK